MGDAVQIELTGDEALVLFEFLSRFDQGETLQIEDQAEEKALWILYGQLEKQVIEPFLPDYIKLLRAARDRLRDPT